MAYSAADYLRGAESDPEEKPLWYELAKATTPEESELLARALFEEVAHIEDAQPHVLENYRRFFKLYTGYDPVAMTWGPSLRIQRPVNPETRGLIRAACDTATALISQHMPKATVSTEGANLRMQSVAADLDLFLQGAYVAGNVYQIAPQIFRDAAITGTGTWAYVPEGSGEKFRVRIERVFPGEVVVPEWQCESKWDGYTERYRVMRWSKQAVRKKWPHLAKAAFLAGPDWTLQKRTAPGPGFCWVIEAFHICGDERRHVIATPGHVLLDESWPYDFFPYDDIHWALPSSGFYGDGIAYRQFAKQQRLDFLHQLIHKGQNLLVNPRIFNMPGAPPQTHNIADLGVVVSGRTDPKFLEGRAFGPEIYNWVETLYRAGLEDEGISTATAANRLPAGLESAPAQQAYSVKEAQRFAPVSGRYEHAVAVSVAEKFVAFYAREANKKPVRVKVIQGGYTTLVPWPEIDIERDVFQLQLGATSMETLTPAGKIQQAMNLVQLQLISPQDARLLIRHPDIKYLDELAFSSRRYCDAFLNRCYMGEIPPIDPNCDLTLLEETLAAGYQRVAAMTLYTKSAELRRAQQALAESIENLKQELQAQAQEAQAAMAPPGPMNAGTEPQPNPFNGAAAGEPPGANLPELATSDLQSLGLIPDQFGGATGQGP